MLRLLVQRFAAAWRRPAPERPATVHPEADAASAAPDAIAAFEARLAGLAGDDAALLAGQLQSVALDEVRDALGAAWPALAPQLLSFAATRLELWTGRQDEIRRHGDAGFVIRFASLEQPAAEQQARRLALRLKAELLENFPLVADGGQPHPSPAAGPAHEVMARRFAASEQFRRAVQRHDGADPRLWRSALGQAVIELLEADAELSTDALITQLLSRSGDELVLQNASIDAAIERLRLLAASEAKGTDEMPEVAPGASGSAA